MFMPLKYKEKDGLTGQILWCRYCATKFVIPFEEALPMITVCENDDCKKAYERGEMATKMDEIKAEQAKIIDAIATKPEVTTLIKKALVDK